MDAPRTLRRALLGRDVAVAYAILVALYVVRGVGVRPLQIPAYLLIVAYDVVEVALPFLTPYHPVGFPLFLYLLATVGAATARRLRSGDEWGSTAIRTAGGVCLIVAAMSLLLGASVGGPLVAPNDNPTPLVVTATTGVVLLVAGWLLLGRPSARGRPAERTER